LANTKSALKAMRQNERRRQRNQPIRSAVKTYLRTAERLITSGDTEQASSAVVKAVSQLDSAAGKGVIHANNAARRKSRLMKKYNAVQQQPDAS
jgi:small subunit ribosomal protein S20